MYKTGHYGAALLLYAPVGFLLLSVDPAFAVLGGVGTVALARLPDYDLRVPFIEHRGVTHTILFVLLTAAVLAVAGFAFADAFGTDSARTAGLGIVVATVAVGSHLLADALTPAGVPLLWPVSGKRFSVDFVTASNPIANYGLLALGIGVTATVGYLAGQV
ncbi:MAG: inner membrane protein [Natronomonas sp.]|jgi:inner membrane protein|uniref:metal-dependent hydrolase n=1 Tax=Natronomonas sp. TaxID=2184060 RepID=UPI003989390E